MSSPPPGERGRPRVTQPGAREGCPFARDSQLFARVANGADGASLCFLLENLRDIPYLARPDGALVYVGPQIGRYGHAPAALVERGFAAFIEPEDRERALADLTGLAEADDAPPAEFRIRTRNGEIRWLEDCRRVLRDAGGVPVVVLGVLRDVTERRRVAEDVEKLEARLRQMQKMEAVGSLAGGIAHDFNNLLTGILAYADLLEQSLDVGSESQRAAGVIARAAERASHLTRQLLGFARVEPLQSLPVDVHEVLDEAWELVAPTVDRRVRLATVRSADSAVVRGDRAQIEQILMNLLVNACDAMPDGGTLRVRTAVVRLDRRQCEVSPALSPGRFLQLEVEDEGEGIPETDRSRVFEPFFTTKETGHGAGMGLAVVYGIVASHGGTIEVDSEIGRGTTFRVLLPLPAEPDAAAARPVPQRRRPEADGECILVVDDEHVVREVAELALARRGYHVLLAKDGDEGLVVYQEHADDVDLVLLDLTMPRMDGRACFHALREIAPDVKVLLMTGHAREGMAQELLDEGALGLVPKPFLMEELALAVADAIAGWNGEDAAGAVELPPVHAPR